MKDRGLLIPFILFFVSALGALAVKKPFAKPMQPGGGSDLVFENFKSGDANQVTLSLNGKKIILSKNEDGIWLLKSHGSWPVETEKVSGLLGAMRDLKKEKLEVSSNPEAYKDFEVRDEDLICEVSKDKFTMAKLFVGKFEFKLNGTYIRLDTEGKDGREVRLAKGDLTDHIKFDVTHYMAAEIPEFKFIQENKLVLRQITVQRPGNEGKFTVERLTKKADAPEDAKPEWKITDPIDFPADAGLMKQIAELVEKFETDDLPVDPESLFTDVMTGADQCTKLDLAYGTPESEKAQVQAHILLGPKAALEGMDKNMHTVLLAHMIRPSPMGFLMKEAIGKPIYLKDWNYKKLDLTLEKSKYLELVEGAGLLVKKEDIWTFQYKKKDGESETDVSLRLLANETLTKLIDELKERDLYIEVEGKVTEVKPDKALTLDSYKILPIIETECKPVLEGEELRFKYKPTETPDALEEEYVIHSGKDLEALKVKIRESAQKPIIVKITGRIMSSSMMHVELKSWQEVPEEEKPEDGKKEE